MNAPATIPLIDLNRQYSDIRSEILAAMEDVLDRSVFVMGADLSAFEKAFADYVDTSDCVGVASGTSALKLAMQALGIGHGDEVIVPANTFIACAFAVSALGADVRFVDSGPDHLIDVDQIERAITPRTKAIMAVHLYGQAANLDRILDLANAHRLFVIEDVSQAHGGTYRGKPLGSFGDVSAFSFYPGKNLGAYGDGGAVCTSNETLAERIRLLRNLGQRSKHVHEIIGENCRLDTLQAAVLRVKLRHLDRWNAQRRTAATAYDSFLLQPGFVAPRAQPLAEHVFQYYVVHVLERDSVIADLAELGIATGIHHPIPIHRQQAYAHLRIQDGTFPQAEFASRIVLSLPMFPEIDADQIERVAGALLACASPAGVA
jgi:dTDP-4-amino-4,6-dideoxygalactose transaminase